MLVFAGTAPLVRICRAGPRSSRDACIVQLPGGSPGAGHCTATAGFCLYASGIVPNRLISALPKSAPQSVTGRFGFMPGFSFGSLYGLFVLSQAIASFGLVSLTPL